ncbi:MAG: hypothetical protein GXZ07_06490 [Firmicutes bacterium]|jgi:hypothetical protein|nr:hypothetical protein [Bacillota bacterium]
MDAFLPAAYYKVDGVFPGCFLIVKRADTVDRHHQAVGEKVGKGPDNPVTLYDAWSVIKGYQDARLHTNRDFSDHSGEAICSDFLIHDYLP